MKWIPSYDIYRIIPGMAKTQFKDMCQNEHLLNYLSLTLNLLMRVLSFTTKQKIYQFFHCKRMYYAKICTHCE